jgi:hypothetical protein
MLLAGEGRTAMADFVKYEKTLVKKNNSKYRDRSIKTEKNNKN